MKRAGVMDSRRASECLEEGGAVTKSGLFTTPPLMLADWLRRRWSGAADANRISVVAS